MPHYGSNCPICANYKMKNSRQNSNIRQATVLCWQWLLFYFVAPKRAVCFIRSLVLTLHPLVFCCTFWQASSAEQCEYLAQRRRLEWRLWATTGLAPRLLGPRAKYSGDLSVFAWCSGLHCRSIQVFRRPDTRELLPSKLECPLQRARRTSPGVKTYALDSLETVILLLKNDFFCCHTAFSFLSRHWIFSVIFSRS